MVYQGFQPLSARGVQLVQKLEVLSVGFCSNTTQTPVREAHCQKCPKQSGDGYSMSENSLNQTLSVVLLKFTTVVFDPKATRTPV